MSDLEKKETAYSKTIQEADTIMARWAIPVIIEADVNIINMTIIVTIIIIIITPSWPGGHYPSSSRPMSTSST